MTPDDEPRALVNCEPGRWAWVLDDSRRVRLDPTFPVKGKQGFFFVDLPHGLWLDCVSTEFVAYTIGHREAYRKNFSTHMVQKAGLARPGKRGTVWRSAEPALEYARSCGHAYAVYKVFLPRRWEDVTYSCFNEQFAELLEDAVIVPGEVTA